MPANRAVLALGPKGSNLSIIEQAARRLEQLRRAGIGASPPDMVGRPHLGSGLGGVDGRVGADGAARLTTSAPVPEHRVTLDLPELAARGVVTPDAPRTRLADEFRGAKRGLLVNVRGQSAAPVKRANCIMVTSSVPGEGKTFTAINLAMSLAMEVDSNVLLIDADVMRPSVMDRLGLPASKGLLDLLTDSRLTLADVALRTNLEKLTLLSSSSASGHATELLASGAMGRLVEQLASGDTNRIVVFDSPPLLAAPETRTLASHVGQIVLVIEAQRTSRSTFTEALELIKDCPVVMTLLSKARGTAGAPYGYGSYVYGANYGSS